MHATSAKSTDRHIRQVMIIVCQPAGHLGMPVKRQTRNPDMLSTIAVVDHLDGDAPVGVLESRHVQS